MRAKASPKAASPTRRVRTKRRRPATVPRALPAKQRLFRWRRYAAAIYYQFDFQRGDKTIYQARTAKLSVALPARLKLRPGTYKALVHPAFTTDAGIVLGAAIVTKTIRV